MVVFRSQVEHDNEGDDGGDGEEKENDNNSSSSISGVDGSSSNNKKCRVKVMVCCAVMVLFDRLDSV